MHKKFHRFHKYLKKLPYDNSDFNEEIIKKINSSLKKLTYLCFEITNKCNFDKLHPKCPINDVSRYQNCSIKQSLTNFDIIEFSKYCLNNSFCGHIGFHYYNEPLLEINNIIKIISAIRNNSKNAKFILWTNGSLLKDKPYIKLFNKIIVTDYMRSNFIRSLAHKYNNIHILKKAKLDNRRNMKNKPNIPLINCKRVNYEMIIDYYGNIRVCCNDYKNELKSSNILSNNYQNALLKWIQIKTIPETMKDTKKYYNVCKRCISSTNKAKIG